MLLRRERWLSNAKRANRLYRELGPTNHRSGRSKRSCEWVARHLPIPTKCGLWTSRATRSTTAARSALSCRSMLSRAMSGRSKCAGADVIAAPEEATARVPRDDRRRSRRGYFSIARARHFASQFDPQQLAVVPHRSIDAAKYLVRGRTRPPISALGRVSASPIR